MTHTVVMHSHRGGTGKSTMLANMALLMAAEGRRVALIDTDIQSPALDVLFRLPHGECSLTDYLMGSCEIEDATHQVSPEGVYLVPARTDASSLGQIMTRGYDVGLLPEAFSRLGDLYDLDVLLVDTHAGLNNETVTSMASADVLATALRVDRVDLAGADEIVPLAWQLACRRALVISMAPEGADAEQARKRAERVYGAPTVGVLPYVAELAALGGNQIFAEAHPGHPLMAEFREIISALV
ncbi:CDP-3, 6-dideoxy-D-glycero-L-glycero-4-hexulose-4-reductase [Sphaerisporangium melleum]|uniref:CDP-3, 6-dideoxy-D-glycero-L-glycero-4-hexulose-4-reductase n=1 Tax=Sphaerisporangium melleum TaxID=321316 RepID=A0A917QQ35_9ACTN|nr:MinD/ParA family protein [Sphaerisporangium melleum]GGK63291.1 CDP-3, 6-dideoxy-D-glycero-L-glycero-4-hexulose-4-reductase [Sphaerisporangium melleum]GII68066.1 CDP-3, 6-dideoxy-D-glycero-L-glycero-4-hexulose-4-reductase [Sphaerisporangium melleum]